MHALFLDNGNLIIGHRTLSNNKQCQTIGIDRYGDLLSVKSLSSLIDNGQSQTTDIVRKRTMSHNGHQSPDKGCCVTGNVRQRTFFDNENCRTINTIQKWKLSDNVVVG